jgi:hypothetical protein
MAPPWKHSRIVWALVVAPWAIGLFYVVIGAYVRVRFCSHPGDARCEPSGDVVGR